MGLDKGRNQVPPELAQEVAQFGKLIAARFKWIRLRNPNLTADQILERIDREAEGLVGKWRMLKQDLDDARFGRKKEAEGSKEEKEPPNRMDSIKGQLAARLREVHQEHPQWSAERVIDHLRFADPALVSEYERGG